ncbi:MAG TPA: PIN domain-containing protein, partial [Nitrospirota bacterium]|nr:PIN domain-containing protein [Nitrospirota bacterium]
KEFGLKLKDSSFVSLISVRDEDEDRAWEIFLRYKDQDFSYTDCTSFAVMERLKLDAAFSFDQHFKAMKFHVVPGL